MRFIDLDDDGLTVMVHGLNRAEKGYLGIWHRAQGFGLPKGGRMDTQTISMEIVKIRSRLREIEKERARVADDDLEAKTDLHDEEIELRARLAELQEMTTGKPDLSKEMAGHAKGKSKPEDYVPTA